MNGSRQSYNGPLYFLNTSLDEHFKDYTIVRYDACAPVSRRTRSERHSVVVSTQNSDDLEFQVRTNFRESGRISIQDVGFNFIRLLDILLSLLAHVLSVLELSQEERDFGLECEPGESGRGKSFEDVEV
jgi:hypothetical protein